MNSTMVISALLAVVGALMLVLIGAMGYAFNRLLNLELKVAEGEPPPWFEHRMSAMETRMGRIEGKVDEIRNGQH